MSGWVGGRATGGRVGGLVSVRDLRGHVACQPAAMEPWVWAWAGCCLSLLRQAPLLPALAANAKPHALLRPAPPCQSKPPMRPCPGAGERIQVHRCPGGSPSFCYYTRNGYEHGEKSGFNVLNRLFEQKASQRAAWGARVWCGVVCGWVGLRGVHVRAMGALYTRMASHCCCGWLQPPAMEVDNVVEEWVRPWQDISDVSHPRLNNHHFTYPSTHLPTRMSSHNPLPNLAPRGPPWQVVHDKYMLDGELLVRDKSK